MAIDCKCRCPFYVRHSRRGKNMATITCEEFMENSGFDMNNQILFKTSSDEEAYMELFCMDAYESCPYFQFIRKYKYKNESS